MLNLSLRQLRYFDALARHRHFGRAAQACAISQPALSEQIKDLEATFGSPLFERGARQVRATALGDALAERVRDILAAIDELDGLAASHHPLRRLRLGVIPTVAPYLLPSVMRELAAAHPELDVHVREIHHGAAAGGAGAGTDRRGDRRAAGRRRRLRNWRRCSARSFFSCGRRREAAKPPPDLKSLGRERLLLLEEGHCFRDQALAVCGLNPLRPRETLEASSLSTLVQMVGAGAGSR